MKKPPSFASAPDRRLIHQDHNRARTLWYADGRSINALVEKVDKDGIHFATPETSGFIKAEDLCTADRVRYRFGTRQESEWVDRVNANVAKHN